MTAMPTGVRIEHGRLRVYVWVNGRLVTERQPRGTTPRQAAERRAVLKLGHRHGWPTYRQAPTLAADVARYLQAVSAMPTFAQRGQHLGQWVTALGGSRPRSEIRAADIRAVLQRWRMNGLGPASCNKRRTALMHLWTVLDGRSAPNPVRDVPRFRPPDALPRGLPYPLIEKILKAMPPSKTKARLSVMAYTGLPPAEIRRLTPDMLDLKAKRLVVPGRRKGAGTRPRVLPLMPQAVQAFKVFIREDAWGGFTSAPLARSFKRACERVGVSGVTPYDLRHAFGAAVYASTGDMQAVQAALGHSTVTLSARYALAAVPARLEAAIAQTGKTLPGALPPRRRKRKTPRRPHRPEA